MTSTTIVPIATGLAGFPLTGIAKDSFALYGMAVEINEYIDKHIEGHEAAREPNRFSNGQGA